MITILRACIYLIFAAFMLSVPCVLCQSATGGDSAQGAAARDGQHDFDFEFGTWKTHLRLSSRLRHPFTGPETWSAYEGTSVVQKIWNGKANMVELSVDGPSGHVDGLNLHLYNPESHQWSLNFASSTGGAMSVPAIGEFRNGRGEFYDQEPINGRMLLVRSTWTVLRPDACHFEQAFSQDGGKTWELNWIADDIRTENVAMTPP
ncbi:MAG: hypothetical protein M3Y50_18630 [Acidobacteriota bacterium]|nr:hypothetical protein [Acidobacteriota bacterium]